MTALTGAGCSSSSTIYSQKTDAISAGFTFYSDIDPTKERDNLEPDNQPPLHTTMR